MKVICDRAALVEVANLAFSAVNPRSPRPQLACMKLSAVRDKTGGAPGRLVVSATDGEMALRLSTHKADVQEPGDALVNAQKFTQIVAAEAADPTLTLQTGQDDCEIRGRDARFKVLGFPVADFPPLPEFPRDSSGAEVFSVNAGTLMQLIERTVFSTARETSRYAINGVLLKRQGRKLEMVATDGRRLALARANAEGGGSGDAAKQCIIPTKALRTVLKLLRDPEATVRIAITENQVFFAFDAEDDKASTVLSSSVVEGSFPPYEEVIPKDQDKKATFDVASLASAVRRAAVLTNEESKGVRMAFTGKDRNRLKITSRAPEMGEAEIDVDMSAYDGTDIEIGFNPAFLIEVLDVVEDTTVVIEMKAPNKPGLIRSGADYQYVVMPVNLQ